MYNHYKCWTALAIFFALLFSSHFALAHPMPAGKGTINIIGSKAYVVLSLPAELFTGIVGSKKIGQKELTLQKKALDKHIRQGIHFISNNETASLVTIRLSLPSGELRTKKHHHGSSSHHHNTNVELLVMIVARFTSPPATITFSSSLWSTKFQSLTIKGTVSEGAKTLKSEVGTLTQQKTQATFFASKFSSCAIPAFFERKLQTVFSGHKNSIISMLNSWPLIIWSYSIISFCTISPE